MAKKRAAKKGKGISRFEGEGKSKSVVRAPIPSQPASSGQPVENSASADLLMSSTSCDDAVDKAVASLFPGRHGHDTNNPTYLDTNNPPVPPQATDSVEFHPEQPGSELPTHALPGQGAETGQPESPCDPSTSRVEDPASSTKSQSQRSGGPAKPERIITEAKTRNNPVEVAVAAIIAEQPPTDIDARSTAPVAPSTKNAPQTSPPATPAPKAPVAQPPTQKSANSSSSAPSQKTQSAASSAPATPSQKPQSPQPSSQKSPPTVSAAATPTQKPQLTQPSQKPTASAAPSTPAQKTPPTQPPSQRSTASEAAANAAQRTQTPTQPSSQQASPTLSAPSAPAQTVQPTTSQSPVAPPAQDSRSAVETTSPPPPSTQANIAPGARSESVAHSANTKTGSGTPLNKLASDGLSSAQENSQALLNPGDDHSPKPNQSRQSTFGNTTGAVNLPSHPNEPPRNGWLTTDSSWKRAVDYFTTSAEVMDSTIDPANRSEEFVSFEEAAANFVQRQYQNTVAPEPYPYPSPFPFQQQPPPPQPLASQNTGLPAMQPQGAQAAPATNLTQQPTPAPIELQSRSINAQPEPLFNHAIPAPPASGAADADHDGWHYFDDSQPSLGRTLAAQGEDQNASGPMPVYPWTTGDPSQNPSGVHASTAFGSQAQTPSHADDSRQGWKEFQPRKGGATAGSFSPAGSAPPVKFSGAPGDNDQEMSAQDHDHEDDDVHNAANDYEETEMFDEGDSWNGDERWIAVEQSAKEHETKPLSQASSKFIESLRQSIIGVKLGSGGIIGVRSDASGEWRQIALHEDESEQLSSGVHIAALPPQPVHKSRVDQPVRLEDRLMGENIAPQPYLDDATLRRDRLKDKLEQKRFGIYPVVYACCMLAAFLLNHASLGTGWEDLISSSGKTIVNTIDKGNPSQLVETLNEGLSFFEEQHAKINTARKAGSGKHKWSQDVSGWLIGLPIAFGYVGYDLFIYAMNAHGLLFTCLIFITYASVACATLLIYLKKCHKRFPPVILTGPVLLFLIASVICVLLASIIRFSAALFQSLMPATVELFTEVAILIVIIDWARGSFFGKPSRTEHLR